MSELNKRILLVFVFFLIIISFFQFSSQNIIGFDGYFHIKTAEVIKEEGFFKKFIWLEHTILTKDYADIQVLFRILLIPFTFFGLNLGAKIASILFSTVCFSTFYWFLNKNKIKYAYFWSIAYFFSSTTLMYRFMFPRQMAISITLLILTIFFMQKKKYIALGIISALFSLLYSGFVIQIFIISVYIITEKIFSRKFDYKAVLFPLCGTALGLLINPYFPKNISMLYTQIFKVNLIANLYNVEWKAWPVQELILNNLLVIIFFIAAFALFLRNKKINKEKCFFVIISVLFLLFTIKSRRMQEYLVPFSVLMAAFFTNDFIKDIKNKDVLKKVKAIGILVIVIIATVNSFFLIKHIRDNDFMYHFDGCTGWIKENVKKNSLIFNNAYAFPYLFFKNSELRYTHGIDLTYSYLYDKEEFKRYIGILRGTLKSDADYIVIDYNPDYLFVGKIKQDVQLYKYIISHKKNYKAVYEDEWCAVLEVK